MRPAGESAGRVGFLGKADCGLGIEAGKDLFSRSEIAPQTRVSMHVLLQGLEAQIQLATLLRFRLLHFRGFGEDVTPRLHVSNGPLVTERCLRARASQKVSLAPTVYRREFAQGSRVQRSRYLDPRISCRHFGRNAESSQFSRNSGPYTHINHGVINPLRLYLDSAASLSDPLAH
jgi:hypothetical protein